MCMEYKQAVDAPELGCGARRFCSTLLQRCNSAWGVGRCICAEQALGPGVREIDWGPRAVWEKQKGAPLPSSLFFMRANMVVNSSALRSLCVQLSCIAPCVH